MIISSARSTEAQRERAKVSNTNATSNTSRVETNEAQPVQSGREGGSISTNMQAMSTNASVNRVLNGVMGNQESSGNSSADALTAAFSSSPEQAATGSNGSATTEQAGAAEGSQPNAEGATAGDVNAPAATSDTPPTPALPPNVQNLMKFGGDRKKAVETLIASGAKGENPEVGGIKNIFRKLGLGGDKMVAKDISADQTIETNVRTRNYNLLDLRLTTKGTSPEGHETRRHTDLETDGMGDGGWTAQVKDAGKVIAKGTPTRMFEQDIKHGEPGQKSEITNNYIDPKTGVPFLRTNEQANWIEADKMGTVKSHKDSSTYRQIDMLGSNGKTDQRYVFDYGNKSIRLEFLDENGQISGSQPMSKDTDYYSMVERLSMAPPSSIPQRPAPAPAPASGEGGSTESPAEGPVPAMV